MESERYQFRNAMEIRVKKIQTPSYQGLYNSGPSTTSLNDFEFEDKFGDHYDSSVPMNGVFR